jgi:hypothetical protein
MKVIYFLFAFVSISLGQIIKTTNWDGTPPGEGLSWPAFFGASYEEWEPSRINESAYSDACELSATVYHSGPRSLKIRRDAGKNGTVDIWYTLPQALTKMYLSFYCYFDPQGWSSNPGYNIPYTENGAVVHFVFLNSAIAPTPSPIDFIQYTNTQGWPPTCLDVTNGGVYPSFGSTNYDGNNSYEHYGSDAGNCWNVRTHTGRWFHFEFMWDLDNHRCTMWIDGERKIDSEFYRYGMSAITKIGFSGWVSQAAQTGFAAIHYIDDIVISESYVGPSDQVNPRIPDNVKIRK